MIRRSLIAKLSRRVHSPEKLDAVRSRATLNFNKAEVLGTEMIGLGSGSNQWVLTVDVPATVLKTPEPGGTLEARRMPRTLLNRGWRSWWKKLRQYAQLVENSMGYIGEISQDDASLLRALKKQYL
jgi:hypothetical protein